MLKLFLAQLGVNIDQEQIDQMMRDAQSAFAAVKAMRESQERVEAMVKVIHKLTVADRDPFPDNPSANITITDHVLLGKAAP